MAEQIKCVCQQWASIDEDYLRSLGKLHHPNCDGKGQNIHSYATEADVQFSHSDAMTLIQKLQQDYFDSLPERWNTDGTRKETMIMAYNEPLTSITPMQYAEALSASEVLYSYSPLNPDVAKLKYGEVDFCDQ
jgi:hypothetical protein